MGLKQDVAKAMSTATQDKTAQAETAQPEPVLPPVQISDEARFALSRQIREWSGWDNATLVIGQPKRVSPYATCDSNKREFTINVDALLLNPNRVLLTVTPFRLKQEGVLTGIMLHEAGHARYSHWHKAVHSDGETPNAKVTALAKVLEEARVEGLMARDAEPNGLVGLEWTMRASAAQVLPLTTLSTDPDQAIMDLVTSWALRAGRQVALNMRLNSYALPRWVKEFNNLLDSVLVARMEAMGVVDPKGDALAAINLLTTAMISDDHTGPTLIDKAREFLRMVFGDEDQAPESGSGCGAGAGESEDSDSQPGGEDVSGNPDDESDEQESDGDEDQSDDEEPGDGQGDGQEDGEDEESDQSEDVSDESDTGAGSDSGTDTVSDLAKALAAIEADAADQAAEEQTKAEQGQPGGEAGGSGSGDAPKGGWRKPNAVEREEKRSAERFLRSLLSPTETSKRTLSESPSSNVDGAALSAWKASGQHRDPHFFHRTTRSVEVSPPVKVAILVDISGSMDVLQKPSAVLSWALASASLDLRNFAGRGQQISSCLIHWGDVAKVVQRNGEIIPGIREAECWQGTTAMGEALRLVEEQMPGFFDVPETPEHRLLVQFTDWQLSWVGRDLAMTYCHRALEAGVNMLSVVPQEYSASRSDLGSVTAHRPGRIQRGRSTLVKYNSRMPEKVWDSAAAALR